MGQPSPVPAFQPNDPEGRRLFAAAEARREARLRARDEHPEG